MDEDKFKYRVEDGTAVITQYIGNENIVVIIPSKLGKYTVTGIGDRAFLKEEKFIGSVEIPTSVKRIGAESFLGCRNLSHVVIGSRIEEIGAKAFSGCFILDEVQFMGDAPRIVGEDIFRNSNIDLKVKHYADARGWQPLFAGKPTEMIHSSQTYISESDEGENEIARDEQLGGDVDADADEDIFKPDEPELVADEEQFWETEEQQYVAGFRDYERVGMRYTKSTSLKNIANPIEAFRIRVSGAFIKLKARGGMSEADLALLIEPITVLPNIKFKNAQAYVLGYIASNKGKGTTKQAFQKACDIMYLINEKDIIVSEPDILRYAVFWTDTISQIINQT